MKLQPSSPEENRFKNSLQNAILYCILQLEIARRVELKCLHHNNNKDMVIT